jgi:hypothetical protein
VAWHRPSRGLAPPWLACATAPPWTPPWTRQVLCILLLLLSTPSSPSARALPTESSYAYVAAAIVLAVLGGCPAYAYYSYALAYPCLLMLC